LIRPCTLAAVTAKHDADVIVVGAGLAGLVAAAELAGRNRRVLLLDQEPQQCLGGQAWWSFGGLFFVDSPEQRRLRIRDSADLAWQDWLGTAGFDRPEDELPRRWAEAYVHFAAGRSGPGCARWGTGCSRSSAGPNAAATPRSATAPGPVRRRRGGRVRRRWHARLPLAGGHVPRRLPVLRAYRGPCGGQGRRLIWQAGGHGA
jgi:choline dehydrogenase-like flavoprotein